VKSVPQSARVEKLSGYRFEVWSRSVDQSCCRCLKIGRRVADSIKVSTFNKVSRAELHVDRQTDRQRDTSKHYHGL